MNRKYAKEFDQRKRREELLNARQSGEDILNGLNSDDESGSSSEEEDEDGELLTPGMDLNIIRTIKALKKKDESIYDKDKKFFDDSEDNDKDEDRKKKSKPMKYKDVVREQILQQMDKEKGGATAGGGNDSDDDTGTGDSRAEEHPSSRFAYDDEQRELRAAFLNSTKDESSDDDEKDDGSDGWMVKKLVTKADADEAQKLVAEEIAELEQIKDSDASDKQSISDPRGEVGDGDKFLLDFIKNRRWVDKDLNDSDSDSDDDKDRGVYRSKIIARAEDDGHDSDASLDELEQMDAFESKYNFRFEEAAAAADDQEVSGAAYSIVGYARGAATDTLRRKDETRKQKRLARKEKKAAERKAKEERLRRLKNAKREELEGRMKQVRQVVGGSEEGGEADIDEAALMKLMEGDYDPEKFEAIMSKAYGDDFYEKEDAEWQTDADVKESLKRDDTGVEGDIIIEDTGGLYDEYNDDDAEEGGQENADGQGNWGGEGGDEEELDFDPEPPEEPESGIEKKLREKMEDELYKLDYEDIIGDMPTRFKYRKVQANRYGLTPQEILFANDTTLKQFVSLKRMAPYREGEEYQPGTKKRKRFRDIAKHDYEELMEGEQKEAHAEDAVATKEGHDEGTKTKKRRRRQKKKRSGAAEETPTSTEDGAAKKEDAATNKEAKLADTTENGGKRKRNKKGKKGGKEKPLADPESILASGSIKADAKKKIKRRKSKEGKSKKKSTKIAGVSESRLAAYGL